MTRERSYRDEAVVLHGRILGEADRIVRLFTRNYGKVDTIAKGVRRPKNPLSGRIEIGAEVDVLLHRGRSLDVIADVRLIAAHWQKLLAPEGYAALSTILEITDVFSELGVPDAGVYELVRATLRAMPGYPDPQVVIPRFSLRILGFAGFAPELEHCIECGRPLAGAPSFVDISGGGLTCCDCTRGRGDRRELTAADTDRFAALARPLGATAPVVMRASPPIAAAIEDYMRFHMGRKLRSQSVQ